MYTPSSVLTLIFSPASTNGGTWTVIPVSSLAGLKDVVAVAFLMLGSVSTTVVIAAPPTRRWRRAATG